MELLLKIRIRFPSHVWLWMNINDLWGWRGRSGRAFLSLQDSVKSNMARGSAAIGRTADSTAKTNRTTLLQPSQCSLYVPGLSSGLSVYRRVFPPSSFRHLLIPGMGSRFPVDSGPGCRILHFGSATPDVSPVSLVRSRTHVATPEIFCEICAGCRPAKTEPDQPVVSLFINGRFQTVT